MSIYRKQNQICENLYLTIERATEHRWDNLSTGYEQLSY